MQIRSLLSKRIRRQLGFVYKNLPDGLWGISFTNHSDKSKWLKHIVYEYVHTKYQGGVKFDTVSKSNYYDNYFYNGIYRSGWMNKNYTIGYPFINELNDQGILNNRIQTHYFAFGGNINKWIQYSSQISWGIDYGKYLSNFNKSNHFNYLLQIHLKIDPTSNLIFQGGCDLGSYYGDNFAIAIRYSKRGLLFRK